MRASNESVAIARYISCFLNEYAAIGKTQSEHTLKAYNDALTLYIGFLETKKAVTPSNICGQSFCSENIEEWLLWLMNDRTNSPETCNNRLAAIRSFLKYLGKKDISYMHLSQAASQIKRKKVIVKKVKGMSKDAVSAMLNAPNPKTKTGRRDMALMVAMYSTAARINELLSLKLENLHLDAKKPYITVIGKGDKVRTLYILPKAKAHIQAHINDAHGDEPTADSYLFFSRNTGPKGKMSQSAVSKQLNKHASAAQNVCKEVPSRVHTHMFRHAKASHWLQDGMNIVQISFLLGHEHLQTTMTYLDITTEQEADALATLEDENDKSAPKKWLNPNSDLSAFCGVRQMTK